MMGTAHPLEGDLRAAREGDRRGREHIVAFLLPTVLGWCARLGASWVDPEEAAHDVVLTVLQRLDRIETADKLQPYAWGVTTRVLASRRRRAWWRRWWPGAVPDPVDPAGGPAADLADRELAAGVRRVLEALPDAQREVLVLCDVEERSASEAAALLGVPEGTVKSRLRLGRARFREIAAGDVSPLVLEPADE
jgi:RNA polymerase sigma-70 factor (ECF subfamily)